MGVTVGLSRSEKVTLGGGATNVWGVKDINEAKAHLGARFGLALDVTRFRPNLLVQAFVDKPFCEDDWVGCELGIGGLRMRVDKRDGRCVVITSDQVTTERNPDILRAVAQDRQGWLGVYGSTVQPGRVALQDPVLLLTDVPSDHL
jgi:uncharacterized protein